MNENDNTRTPGAYAGPMVRIRLLQRRVVQTVGSSAVDLTSLILGRSVRVTSATHGEAELEDTVRALRNPGSAAGRLLAAGEGGRLITTSGPKSAVVLESCLADKMAFAERTRRLIREQLAMKLAA